MVAVMLGRSPIPVNCHCSSLARKDRYDLWLDAEGGSVVWMD